MASSIFFSSLFNLCSEIAIYSSSSMQVPADAAYLYDAVHIYAKALNECLIDKCDSRDGRLMFEYIKNRPYKSKTLCKQSYHH